MYKFICIYINTHKANFSNKAVELVNLSPMLFNAYLVSLLKDLLYNFAGPSAVCNCKLFYIQFTNVYQIEILISF